MPHLNIEKRRVTSFSGGRNEMKEQETPLKTQMKLLNQYMKVTNKHFEVTDLCITRLKIENIMLLILMSMICFGLFISR